MTAAVRMQVAQMDLRAAANNACRAATEAVRTGNFFDLTVADLRLAKAQRELVDATAAMSHERSNA